MKLKRCLLRYEPVGVGLEVETDAGTIEVVHRDLPPSSDVSSIKEVSDIVDKLIESEPEVLTMRRHRPALLQVLGRLYSVDMDGLHESNEDETEKPVPTLREGQQAVLVGLTGKQSQYNGDVVIIQKIKSEKDKYEVQLQSTQSGEQHETVKVKGGEHLVPAMPGCVPLEVGVHVCLRNLRNHAELNGCLGHIAVCHEDCHRYEVRDAASGQLFRVKQENVIVVEPPESVKAAAASENDAPRITAPSEQDVNKEFQVLAPGTVVQLHALKSTPHFNGHVAEVVAADDSRGRYQIMMSDGKVKTVRPENVRVVVSPGGKRSKNSLLSRAPH